MAGRYLSRKPQTECHPERSEAESRGLPINPEAPNGRREIGRRIVLIAGVILVGWTQFATAAEQVNVAEARLREALRAMTLQLRAAQADRDAAAAVQADLERQKGDLKKIVDKLQADKGAAEKRIETIEARAEKQQEEISALKEALAKSEESCSKTGDALKVEEDKRAKAAMKAIEMERKASDREAKNIELYKLGSEILRRYERFHLGDVMLAHEPFTGIAKVKLRTLVQDYQDKLTDQKVKP